MRTKNIFKTLVFAMLMPAMLLTTACSSEDDVVNSNIANLETVANKGYALPVTVNVTREGDKGSNRATYNDGTRTLAFSTGDKLFVYGDYDGLSKTFAGTLTWQSGGTFSGTIYTSDDYSGTADELFSAADYKSATLLPNGYESIGFLSINDKGTSEKYDDVISISKANAFVASETAKATGVEQLSWEDAYSYSSVTGFALEPQYAILNFTITGLAAGAQDVTLKVTDGPLFSITGSVTPNASGVATFAIGVPDYTNIQDVANNLTIGSSNFTLPSNKDFYKGNIYNITRGTGATVNLSTTAYTAKNGETLTGTLGSKVQISIEDGATVILNNVNINGSGTWTNGNFAGITCEGDATIILSGTNTVKGFNSDYPGIYVPENKTVTIQGSGSLNASSNGSGAGIGGGIGFNCGNITITGGNITATGGNGRPGIGGGTEACGNITITGGTITATGGNAAAGIGGSNTGNCGDITITSGVTRVTATKGNNISPNSIGAGAFGTCGTVTIGGTVYWDGSAYKNGGDTYLPTSPLVFPAP